MRCGSMTQGRPPELKDPQRMEIYTDQDTRDILNEALIRTNWGSRSEVIRGALRHIAVEFSFSCMVCTSHVWTLSELVASMSMTAP